MKSSVGLLISFQAIREAPQSLADFSISPTGLVLAANQSMAKNVQGTLVGLLAAFSYELSILHTASRLTSADAFRALHALYRERTHPVSAAFPASDAPSSSTGKGGGVPQCMR
jgi:hypothetical protein